MFTNGKGSDLNLISGTQVIGTGREWSPQSLTIMQSFYHEFDTAVYTHRKVNHE